jgi:hypothetical protein
LGAIVFDLVALLGLAMVAVALLLVAIVDDLVVVGLALDLVLVAIVLAGAFAVIFGFPAIDTDSDCLGPRGSR